MIKVRLLIFLFAGVCLFFSPTEILAQLKPTKIPLSKFWAQSEAGQMRLVDSKGRTLDSLSFDSVTVHSFRTSDKIVLFKAWTQGRFYLKNAKGLSIYPSALIDVYPWDKYLCYSYHQGNYGLMEGSGRLISPAKYSHFLADSNHTLIYAYAQSSSNSFEILKPDGKRIGQQFQELKIVNKSSYLLTDPDRQVYLFKPGSSGQIMIGPYQSMGPFIDGIAVVTRGPNIGLINQNGQELLPVVFQDIKILGKGHVLAQKQTGWVLPGGDTVFAARLNHLCKGWYACSHAGLWDIFTPHHQLLAFGFEEVLALEKNYFLVKRNGLWGSLDTNGHVLVPILFEELSQVHQWPFLIGRQGGKKYSLIDEKGKVLQNSMVAPQVIEEAAQVWIKTQKFYKVFDFKEKIWHRHQYDTVGSWTGTGYKVSIGGRWGLIDVKGNWKIGPLWPQNIQFVGDEHSILRQGSHSSITDLDGCSIPLLYFDSVSPSGPLLQVWRKGKTGLINIDGEVMFPLVASSVLFLPEWYIWQVRNDTAFGTISRSGCFVSQFANQYDSMCGFVQQRALVKKQTGWGMIDPLGRLRIAPRYQALRHFQGTQPRAAIQLQDRWGFIDEADQIVVQPFYSSVEDYRGSVAMVYKEDQAELIGANGKVLIKPTERYEWTSTGDFIFYQNGKMGLINSEGVRLLEALAMDIKPIGKDHFQIRIGSQNGLMDRSGNWRIQPSDIETFFINQHLEICYKISGRPQVYHFTFQK